MKFSMRIQWATVVAVIAACFFCGDNINNNNNNNNDILVLAEDESGDNFIDSAELLAKRWAIPEPHLELRKVDNTIVVNYDGGTANTSRGNSDSSNDPYASPLVSVWSGECPSGGGIKLPPGSLTPGWRSASVDLKALWKGSREYVFVSSPGIADADHDKELLSLRFCVRYALATSSSAASEQKAIEMNVAETMVKATVVIQMTEEGILGSFALDTASIVGPMEEEPRKEDTNNSRGRKQYTFYHNDDNDYAITAFLCKGENDNTPHKIPMSQGSIHTICVQPVNPDGMVRVVSIDDFTWRKIRITRTRGGDKNALTKKDIAILATQEAIRDGNAADQMTIHHGCDSHDENRNDYFCTLSSLLTADFYTRAQGTVGGFGWVSFSIGGGRQRNRAAA